MNSRFMSGEVLIHHLSQSLQKGLNFGLVPSH